MPVLDAVGLICGSAEEHLPVRFIFRVVSLESDHLALTLKRKHMCADYESAVNCVHLLHGDALFFVHLLLA